LICKFLILSISQLKNYFWFRNSSKGRGGEEEKKEASLPIVHSPILKKPALNSSSGGTNRIQFKRCESQSIDDNSSDESETP